MNFEQKYLKYKEKYVELQKNTNMRGGKQDIYVIGVAGGSGCGKSQYAHVLKHYLLREIPSLAGKIEVMSGDDYYKPYPGGGKAPPDFNWDIPSVIDLPYLATQVDALKNRKESVVIPKYNFNTSQRDPSERTINGATIKVLIIEGLYILYDPTLRNLFDLKIFTLAENEICLSRRLGRDYEERNGNRDASKGAVTWPVLEMKQFTEQTINQYVKKVKPSYEQYIEPTRSEADIIIYTNTDYTERKLKTFKLIKEDIIENLN